MTKAKQKLIDTHPGLCEELKNPEDGLNYTYGSGKKIWWVCLKCGYDWKSKISNRSVLGRGCPYCAGKIVTEDNCLNSTHLELCKDLLNKEDGYKYTSGSGKKVWWLCNKCSYEWKASVINRVKGRGCPKCANILIDSSNCLYAFYPYLCEDLKNKEQAFNLSKGSNRDVDWICKDCGYEWKCKVHYRVKYPECPYCSGKIKGIHNCLYVTHPKLCKELKFSEEGYKVHKTYVGKVWWLCNKCSYEWKASVINRVKGRGCPKCANRIKITTEDFIERSKEVYKDNYDYSLTIYKNMKTKITLICKKHNIEFLQIPDTHLRGSVGCPLCNSVTTQDFLKKVKKVHKNNYDYSLIHYKSNKIKIEVTCKVHGSFKIFPSYFLKGYGCPKCYDRCSKLNTEDFIERSNKVHNNIYDYSLVTYISNNKKVKIICKKHGEFEQRASGHMSGYGCPQCAVERNLVGRREEQLLNLLKPHFEDLKSQHKISKYVVDFSILNKNHSHILVLEYDEYNHYKHFNCKISDYSLKNQKLRQEKIIKSLKKKFNKVSFLRVPDCNIKREEIDLEIIYEFTKDYLERFLENDLEERVIDPEFIWNKS